MLLFNNGPHPDTNYFDCLWCSNNLSSKMGHSRLLFLYFCLFNKIDRKQMFHKILMMDDWSRTADLWCRKRPLYQLGHNHFPKIFVSLSVCDNSIFCILSSKKLTKMKQFQFRKLFFIESRFARV